MLYKLFQQTFEITNKQTKYMWLEVQDQGAGKVMLPLRALGKSLFRPLSWLLGSPLLCGSTIPIFFEVQPGCMSVPKFPVPKRNPVALDQRLMPLHRDHISTVSLCNNHFSKQGHILGP